MKTKPLFIGKMLLALLSVIICVGLSFAGAAAADPPKFDTGCTGDEKTCICPTTGKNTSATCGQDIVFQNCEAKSGRYKTDCIKNNNLFDKYVNPAIRALTFMVGLAVTIGIIVGGITYGTSGGDPQKAAHGKQYIRNAIVALLVYFILFAALQFLIPGNIFKT